jgi:Lrp/AsnC family transcriptional regulator for asnA, asnC and gidA
MCVSFRHDKISISVFVLQIFYKKLLKFIIFLFLYYIYCEFVKNIVSVIRFFNNFSIAQNSINTYRIMNSTIIDEVDKKILSLLMQNANMPYTEIGKKINVSGGTVHVRMTKMEEAGIVIGSQLIIDHTKLGWDISAFLGIYLDKSSLYEEVAIQLQQIPEVVSINYTTGIYSIFAKIVCRDTVHLREVLHDKIQKVQGIQRTETFISLEESLNRPVPFTK